jgi:hypothetical protein
VVVVVVEFCLTFSPLPLSTVDVALDLGISGDERYSEFLDILSGAWKQATKSAAPLPVKFGEPVPFNPGRNAKKPEGTPMGLKFAGVNDPKRIGATFKKEKVAPHSIVYNNTEQWKEPDAATYNPENNFKFRSK